MPTRIEVGVGPVRVDVRDHRYPPPPPPHHHHPRPPVVVVTPPPAYPPAYPPPPYYAGPRVQEYANRIQSQMDYNRDGWVHVNEPYDYRQREFLRYADSRYDARDPYDRPDGWVSRRELALAVRDRLDWNHDNVIDGREQQWAQVNFGF